MAAQAMLADVALAALVSPASTTSSSNGRRRLPGCWQSRNQLRGRVQNLCTKSRGTSRLLVRADAEDILLDQKSGAALRAGIDEPAGAVGPEGPPAVFPRINVRDPFKRLGISPDASEEEIQEARNFLVNQYAGHDRSREAIERAYDKIIMESFQARKKSKINLKSNVKKVAESPPWVRNLVNMFEVPSTQVILQRAVFFVLLGVWSVMNSAEGGPAFQVAVSLAGCIYLLNDRLKRIWRALILGFGTFVVGWVFGSFLVPVLPSSIFPRSWTLQLSTALISYIFLWFSCTFLK